jgi:hypothetical protein
VSVLPILLKALLILVAKTCIAATAEKEMSAKINTYSIKPWPLSSLWRHTTESISCFIEVPLLGKRYRTRGFQQLTTVNSRFELALDTRWSNCLICLTPRTILRGGLGGGGLRHYVLERPLYPSRHAEQPCRWRKNGPFYGFQTPKFALFARIFSPKTIEINPFYARFRITCIGQNARQTRRNFALGASRFREPVKKAHAL